MGKYAVGIDLGTTHSALSWFSIDQEKGRGADQKTLAIPQIISPGQIEAKSLLPSFLYLPGADEFKAESLELPWGDGGGQITGEFARFHGAKVPSRLVSSAKSWLCNPAVDRTAPILPWQAPADVHKISPLDASRIYLEHLKNAWEKSQPESPLSEQDVVLTVPASFDAAARDLTVQAASLAGLKHLTLLEEPQAALYSWLEMQGEGFRKQVSVGDILLVIDVGGGTTDFSLIAVTESNGDMQLTRLAVGDHILLGGDNMDLALAVAVQQKIVSGGKKMDAFQFSSLTHLCRQAKEALYGNSKLEKFPVSIASRGSALIGGTIKSELTRQELDSILTEGFFPRTAVEEWPVANRRNALTQLSLPYAQDAGITRHLAAFLGRQVKPLSDQGLASLTADQKFVVPTAVLFNGGVFKASPLQERMMDVLNSWIKKEGGMPAKVLQGADLDLSVARGAAYYGWVRQGHGIRIRGGTAQAYYVGIESSMPAIPGFTPPLKGICVAPFGMEEGTDVQVNDHEFGLLVGEPTSFRFFSSSLRRNDKAAEIIDEINDDFEELAPIEATLEGTNKGTGAIVPVKLKSRLTETGTLEVHCLEANGPGDWKLELNVRLKE
ncbi:MAG: DnaK-related protein [Verrucomicrobiales bacterium]|nr:DnaK-related protein [Verrucomicrobiales bacterium]